MEVSEETDYIKYYFSGKDNPDGKLNKEKMMEMYASVLPPEKAKVFVDQIFLKFDSDKSDTIDFKVMVEPSLFLIYTSSVSFVLGVHACNKYVRDRKLRGKAKVGGISIWTFSIPSFRWAFKMYDKDGSGSIEIEEMVEIVGNMFELEGLSKVRIIVRPIKQINLIVNFKHSSI